MAYIPEKHMKYDLLPMSRRNGGEVIIYDSKLFDVMHDRGCYLSFPYNIGSYEEYYKEIDTYMSKYPHFVYLLQKYKEYLIQWNNKNIWGIVRYHGESNSSFTKDRFTMFPYVRKMES